MASRDDRVQEFLASVQPTLPWNEPYHNWIYPTFTSVSGNKSDRYIVRNFSATTKLTERCIYQNTVDISLEHTYTEADRSVLREIMDTFGLANIEERRKMAFIQGDGKNRSYIRYFVPSSATLAPDTSDITVEQSHIEGVQVWSFQLDTNVGETSQKTISYTIPIPSCSGYNESVNIIRQPGLHNFNTP